jgi:hypothetical protein
MTEIPKHIPDETWRYLFPQETAYNMGRARQVEDIYHPGDKKDWIEENPSLTIGAGGTAGGIAGYLLKEYLLDSTDGPLKDWNDSRLKRNLLTGLTVGGALGGAALSNYLLVKPKIDAANKLVDALKGPNIEKKSGEWQDAWNAIGNDPRLPVIDSRSGWETTKDYASTAEKAMLYGFGGAAVVGGLAYLYDKDAFKKFLRNRLLKIERNLKKDEMAKGNKNNIMEIGKSMSLGGPGYSAQLKGIPLGAVAHTAGVGLNARFTSKDVQNILQYIPFVSKKHAKKVESYLPPKMYVGAEVSPLPFTAGAIADSSNRKETAQKLQKIRGLLAHKDIEQHFDKKVYDTIGLTK